MRSDLPPMERRTPVRKIGIQTRSLTGRRANGNQFESALERDFMALMEWDPGVHQITPQPVRVSIGNPVAGRRTYTPDFLVEWTNNDGGVGRTELVEVKYREAFRGQWRSWRAIGHAAQQYALERGWRFRFITERHIRTPRLTNVSRLLAFRHREASPAATLVLHRRMAVGGPMTVAELTSPDPREPLETSVTLLNALWIELAWHRLAFCENEPLTSRSVIQTRTTE